MLVSHFFSVYSLNYCQDLDSRIATAHLTPVYMCLCLWAWARKYSWGFPVFYIEKYTFFSSYVTPISLNVCRALSPLSFTPLRGRYCNHPNDNVKNEAQSVSQVTHMPRTLLHSQNFNIVYLIPKIISFIIIHILV